MDKTHDYVPSDAEQFRLFMLNLLKAAEEKYKEWGIPSEALEDLEGLYADFVQAFNAAGGAPTSPAIRARQKAQEKVTGALGEFIDRYLQFPPVSGPDRAQMGIQ